MATTTNYNWTIPTVGGDTNNWGTILNTTIGSIDTNLNTVSTTATAAAVKSNNLSDLTSAATARTNLGLGTMATLNQGDAIFATSPNFSASITNSHAISFSGSFTCSGDITAFASDATLKTIDSPIENALERLDKITGYNYHWNEEAQEENSMIFTNEPQVGLLAQEVQEILPEVVKQSPAAPKKLTIQYEKLVPLLVNAIKELKAEMDILKNGSDTSKSA